MTITQTAVLNVGIDLREPSTPIGKLPKASLGLSMRVVEIGRRRTLANATIATTSFASSRKTAGPS